MGAVKQFPEAGPAVGLALLFRMANPQKRLRENASGDFFVDSTCIDCDTCRQLAPEVFAEGAEYSFVHRQPQEAEERRRAMQAILACPTGSIGSLGDDNPKAAMADFPLLVDGQVYYCGFTSPKSYGGSSYFIRRNEGNWLVDSPKFLPGLVHNFEEWGGIAHVFLTHRDDVADAERFARHFSSTRHIHRLELSSQLGAEHVLESFDPLELAEGMISIPTPGHTAGHCCLLLENHYLFTGDHLWWDRDEHRLGASKNYCWHSWDEQIESMQRLADFSFEWILPGHGQRAHLPAEEMRAQVLALVERMQKRKSEPAIS
jgi:glyoxylase-like metal-dependent hydrolase (beta-lactamase superfamily II)/ferredoxin